MLGLSLSFVLISRARRRLAKYKYLVLVLAAIALIANHVTNVCFQAFFRSSSIQIRCLMAKSVTGLTDIVFSGTLMGYAFITLLIILDWRIPTRKLNIAIGTSILVAMTLVSFEACFEVLKSRNHYCGFGTFQTAFHWFITAPKLFMTACTLVLACVAIYGVYVLPQSRLQHTGRLHGLRVTSVCVTAMTAYNTLCEFMLILLHILAIEEYDVMTSLPECTHVYFAMSALRGMVLVVVVCIADPQTCSLLTRRYQRGRSPRKQQKARDPDPVTVETGEISMLNDDELSELNEEVRCA